MIGSSIANIYARDSFTAQRAMVSLNALYGDRFILGLGVSHIPMVEGLRGHRYDKPLAAMGAYLDGINKSAPAGELPRRGRSTPTEDAGAERCQVAWRCPIQRDAEAYGRGRRVPRAFEVARGGAEGNARDRSREGAGARAQGTVALMVLPNYRNSWLRQGFTEAELADGSGYDRFIDAMVLWGDADTIRRGLQRTSRPAPRMSVCNPSTRMAISPPATACWPRSPIPEARASRFGSDQIGDGVAVAAHRVDMIGHAPPAMRLS